MEWMLMPYRKLYRLIEGRSTRREYWMFVLLNVIIACAFMLLMVAVIGGAGAAFTNPTDMAGMMAGAGAIALIFVILPLYVWALLTGVAGFAVAIRRLHDLGQSGWMLVLFYAVLIVATMISMYLYWLVAIGGIVVLCLPGTPGANKYGADPLSPDSATFA